MPVGNGLLDAVGFGLARQLAHQLQRKGNGTAHAAFQDKLAGAKVLDTEVVVDGNITTSYGLGGAIPFALELVRQLAGQAEADRIQNAIAYRH